MSKLYAFGCSYTYGDETSDWYIDPSRPSKYAWPNILSNHLNKECVNLSKSGSSNDSIFKTVLFTIEDITDSDIVVVMMTFPDRKLSIKGNLHPTQKRHKDFYINYHNSELGNLNFIQNLYSIRYRLSLEKFKFFITFTDNRPYLETRKYFPNFKISKEVIILGPGLGFFKDIADKKHPDDNGHREIALYLLEKMKLT